MQRLVVCLLAITSAALAEEAKLAPKIDALLSKSEKAAPADDAELLRRVWLDFDGGIPTAEEALSFLADKSADKRSRLIDRLIDAPRFAERMAEAFHVMLMERRGENEAWKTWLVESFKTNKPWDAMVREMLAPDFLNEQQRGAGYFITRRLEKVGQQDTDYPGLTRDVGRMFMGIDLQCCQCHRHLSVTDYKQIDFNGLYTVYQNLKLQPVDDKHKTPWVSEGLIAAKYEFVSVFTDKKEQTAPRIPFGEEVMIPVSTGDDGWLVKPDRKTKEVGQPKFSPLREIAQRVPAPENALFAKNIANRVWWLLNGKGIVEPLDLHHTENPPSHPELLELLGKELTAHHFDLRWLIREIALTKHYQRAGATQRHLIAEQQLRAFLAATGERERLEKNKKPDAAVDAQKYSLADFEKAFAAALANPAKEPELAANPSLRSALFLRNSDHVQWALKPREGNLIDQLSKQSDPADDLYLTVLTRLPDADEKAELAAWLAKHADNKAQALSDYAWALLSSTEFFVNH
ncbi:DUF1549 domain-containing protein [Prosthecobacter sp.]|uniref:DUF1549 domain-containing protein n=1 Tax=Prosthecobacter sp. TaxID=1965333 RepID=UPI001DF4D967|nr:DUF1549 domain-containing protein [Prosthecobacter sp.]MCB1278591.1 DUF1549 domain-containing protein [Prosthecobacter sp.]